MDLFSSQIGHVLDSIYLIIKFLNPFTFSLLLNHLAVVCYFICTKRSIFGPKTVFLFLKFTYFIVCFFSHNVFDHSFRLYLDQGLVQERKWKWKSYPIQPLGLLDYLPFQFPFPSPYPWSKHNPIEIWFLARHIERIN